MSKKKEYISTFLGRKVNAVIDFEMTETQQEGDTMVSSNQPLVFTGYLIDYDDSYLFIGDEDGDIKQIILRDKLISLQIDPEATEEENTLLQSDKNLN